MKASFSILIAQSLVCIAIAGPAWAQNPLDDAIYSIKCLAADDKEACKAKARQAFEDYQKSKQSGGVAATVSSDGNRIEKCQDVTAKGPADVDTAYARAISTFHFQTYEEKSHHGNRSTVVDDGYKHIRTPGAIYEMWDRIRLDWPARSKTVRFSGSARLAKEGAGSIVTAQYCLVQGANSAEFADPAFWQFADDAFRSLVR